MSAGENIIFRDNDGYKKRLSPPVPKNEDNFATFSLGLEFLNEEEKEKNNGKGDSVSAPSRFASLSVFCVGFDAQFHRLCYKTIGSCF